MDVIHVLGLLASVYLLLVLLLLSLVAAVSLYVATRLLGYAHRRLAGALGKGARVALALERGSARSARAAAAPIVFGRRVTATARALWRRATRPMAAWRGVR